MFIGIIHTILANLKTAVLTTEQINSEENLIRLLKSGDKKGMETLYENYSAAIFGVLLRIVTEQETAEDLLQEVFVKIWKNISAYDASKGRLFTWLVNVARNTAIDKLRSKDFQKAGKIQSLDNSVYSINKNYHSENAVDHIGLKKIVEQLKPEYFLLIDLLYFKGYTQTEAAVELNIPLGTVKTRTRAALTELRKSLNS